MKTATQNAAVIFTVNPADILPVLTERQINNRMKKIADLDAEIKKLQAAREALADEVKQAMKADTIETGAYKITYKEITSARFDSKAFKADHPKQYAAYTKQQTYKRFTYTAKGGN